VSSGGGDRCLTPERAAELARAQDAHLARRDVLIIDGAVGDAGPHSVSVRLCVEASHPNLAAFQQLVYFPPPNGAAPGAAPEISIVCTPTLRVQESPGGRAIAVEPESGLAWISGSDYFGEVKRSVLRIWARRIWDRGGLPLAAGCRLFRAGDGTATPVVLAGRSGGGKSTLCFAAGDPGGPLQEDRLGLMPDGTALLPERGCFVNASRAGTGNGSSLHELVANPRAYLQNVPQRDAEPLFDAKYGKEGRAAFELPTIAPADVARLRPRLFVLLVRSVGVMPAVSRLSAAQAAAHFALAAANGSPGSRMAADGFASASGLNPFFTVSHGRQAMRFLDLVERGSLEVYLLNTGWVGGSSAEPGALKVRSEHSLAIVRAIAEESIEWRWDSGLGCVVAATVPGIERSDEALLRPREAYAKSGRLAEHADELRRFKIIRREYLATLAGLTAEVKRAI
jgi:phosphoenolpyruvate carboxykinase (ATP)